MIRLPVVEAERKQETFWRGIDCFNQRRFFACQEALEPIWLEELEAEKPFYQGLIQVAAGFHQLLEKRNPKGALSLVSAGAEMLRRYPPARGGLALAPLLRALAPWLPPLTHKASGEPPPVPTIPLV